MGFPRCAGWRRVPPRTASTAHVEIKSNRDVTPRLQLDRVIQVDDDCGVSRPQVHGRARRMVSSDVLVVAGGTRFAVLTESDGESVEPLVRPTGQRRSQDDVNTIPASSGAAAAHLISVGGGVQWEGHISSQPLPTFRDDNSSDDEDAVWGSSTSTPRRWMCRTQSFPRLEMCRVFGAQADVETQAAAAEVFATSDFRHGVMWGCNRVRCPHQETSQVGLERFTIGAHQHRLDGGDERAPQSSIQS